MEQLANSIVAAKTFDDVTAIMRAELGDEELDSRVGPWDPNSATFSVDQWERDYQTYNALIETMRDRGTYTPSPITLQAARHAIDYLITDITRNNATILRALGYEKEASEIEADGTAYEEEEAELAD